MDTNSMDYIKISLPVDLAPKDVPPSSKAQIEQFWDSRNVDPLGALAEEWSMPKEHLFAAAVLILLYRYTGRTDLLLAFPAGHPGSAECLSLEFEGHESFLETARFVSKAMETGREPAPDSAQVFFGWGERILTSPEDPAEGYELYFQFRNKGTGIEFGLYYDASLFDRETMSRMAANLLVLLNSLAAEPDGDISRAQVMTEEEKSLQLTEWNRTETGYRDTMCLHEIFEQFAESQPDCLAAVFGKTALSYGELNERANQLAHFLRENGVGPEVRVGLYLNRSVEMILGLLAIMKAGGAYVPLDPDEAPERIELVLSDSEGPVLITENALVKTLPPLPTRIVCLDEEWDAISHYSRENPPRVNSPLDPAYVLYTSGSTGRPKGAWIHHAGVVNVLDYSRHEAPIAPGDAGSLWTTLSFDASVLEIWTVLGEGGSLHIVPKEIQADQDLFLDFMAENRIITGFTPFFMISGLVNRQKENPVPIKRIFTGVESILEAEMADVVSQSPGLKIFNCYGPTETTIISCCYVVPPKEEHYGIAPIGRVLPNMKHYVLDEHMQPVPIGAPGELYIGGVGVSKGYLKRPELNEEKFVPNPFGSESFGRLYRTGDKVRYLADGNLLFIGRIDFQVKLRGFRIELGEIEKVLSAFPGVSETLAIVREDEPGDKRLAAYLVSTDGTAIDLDGMREHLAARLPKHMHPSALIQLPKIPVNNRGKIDRKALPVPDWTKRQTTVLPPETETEKLLAALWADVLGLPEISRDDDFFALGGHSLLAARVAAGLRKQRGVSVPIKTFFENPVLSGLAAVIDSRQAEMAVDEQDDITIVDRSGTLPLSFAQERLWFLDQLEGSHASYNEPTVIKLAGKLDQEALHRSLSRIVSRHEALRTVMGLDMQNHRPVQVIKAAGPVDLPLNDLRRLPPNDREFEFHRLADRESSYQFNLSEGPLIRFRLIRMEDEHHCLVIVAHHTVIDGWSIGLLFQELASCYAAFASGIEPNLPELPVQYADYAVWQRKQVQNERIESQISYWKEKLKGAPPLLELPTDRPRPAVQTYKGDTLKYEIDAGLSGQLKSLSLKAGVSLFMTMLSGFALLMAKLSGQDDFCVGSPIVSRGRREIESLVGFFLNTMVMRMELSEDPAFETLLDRVRRSALEAYENQDVPFEKLVEELKPERSLSYNPLFQVFFNMFNFPFSGVEAPGMKFELEPLPQVESKFDMTLYLEEKAETINLELLYNCDLFDRERMAGMLEQYRWLLEQAVGDPQRRFSDFSTLTAKSSGMLPDPAAILGKPWPGDVGSVFSRRAAATPEKTAVAGVDYFWTYGDLELRANQLARLLVSKGSGKGTIVAVYGYRSPELVLALLGIVKAGAGFMVMDPDYPPVRLVECLKIAQPAGLIALAAAGTPPVEIDDYRRQAGLEEAIILPALPEMNHLGIFADISSEPPGVEIHQDDLAYVAFTSGTTGIPRGIVGDHGPLSHFLDWHQQRHGFSADDRFSMLSGLSHDPLLRDIFTPLWTGASLYVPDPGYFKASDRMVAWMDQRRITVAHMTPATGQLLYMAMSAKPSDDHPSGELKHLRHVFFGGDALTVSDTEIIRRLAPNADITNFYGATETPQAMAFMDIGRNGAGQLEFTPSSGNGQSTVLPVGAGIRNAQLLVLNRKKRLCGIGELGEIGIRSPFLSRGYLGNDSLTHEKFITNPMTGLEDDRIYRTGDLGRYLLDGKVAFFGRADEQVKVRGFRIEPGEIRAVLASHPDIAESAVVARDYGPGDKRLIAYVVPKNTKKPDMEDIRRLLGRRLPPYMMPSALVTIESIPLTPNGKLDRAALPSPDTAGPSGNYVPPDTEREKQLCKLWQDVLGVPQVGIHDNFFDLGGHSLLIVRLLARIQKETGISLPLVALFEMPTVAQLADRLGHGNMKSHEWKCLVPIKLTGSRRVLFHVGFGSALHRLAGYLHPDQPFYALYPHGVYNELPLLGSIEEYAVRCLKELLEFQPQGPYLISGFCNGGLVAMEMAQMLRARGETVKLLFLVDTYIPGAITVTKSKDASGMVRLLRHHWAVINAIKAKDRARYIRDRITNRLRKGLYLKFWRAVYNYCLRTGRPLPRLMRNSEEAYRSIKGNYRPGVWQGDLILFQATRMPPGHTMAANMGWDPYVNGRIVLHEMDLIHAEMYLEPHVEAFSADINQHLERVHALEQRERGT